MTALRTEAVVAYRRYIARMIIAALQAAFDSASYKEAQIKGLQITQKYPQLEQDYPCIVVEYEDRRVVNAGIAHEEWFDDAQGERRKWFHRRFEGTLYFSLYGLSPLDRDILADAMVELLSFGRLDPYLLPFFNLIYGDPQAQAALVFSQLNMNTDELEGQGNNVSIPSWSPEDTLVYATGYAVEVTGGFYNTTPSQSWTFIRAVDLTGYVQQKVTLDGHFELSPPPNPHASATWSQIYIFEDNANDDAWPQGKAKISGVDTKTP